MKKPLTKIVSLFLALLMTASVFPITAFAVSTFEYYGDDGELWVGYYCCCCDDAIMDGYNFNYCTEDDDELCCDSCFCSSCNRCEEHCICEAKDETPIEYSGDELEYPEIPDLPDYPDYEAKLDDLESLLSRAREGLNSDYKLDHYADGTIHAQAWNLFDYICGKDNETACIDHLWNSTDYKAYTDRNDSAYLNSKGTSASAQFLQKALQDSKVGKTLTEGFRWTDKTTLDQKYANLENWLTALKALAKNAGYPEDALNKLRLERGAAGDNIAMKFGIVMEGSYDDAVRPFRYVITVPETTLSNGVSGQYDALLFAHEFQHFLDAVSRETVYNSSTDKLVMNKQTEASAIRFYLAHIYYSNPDFTYANSEKDEEYLLHLNSLMVYYSQLDERHANQTMNELYKKYTPEERDLGLAVFEKWGYEIMPVAIRYMNSLHFDEKGMTYLDAIAKLVPELGMISADFDMMNLVEIDDGDRSELDRNGGDRDGNNATTLLFRYMASDGTNYVLPTRALYDWVVQTTGKKPFEWEDMVKATVGGSRSAARAATKAPAAETENTEHPVAAAIPAELFEYYRAIALMLQLNEACAENENRYAEAVARIEQLLDDAERLELSMDSYDDIENDADDLEDKGATAAQYGEELEGLIEEYEDLSFDAELLWDERESALEDYADELNDAYNSVLDTDGALGQTPEELAESLQSDYEARISELQEEIDDIEGQLAEKMAEIEAKEGELSSILSEITPLADELEERCNDAETTAAQLEGVWEELDELYALLEKAQSAAELPAEAEEPERVLSVTVTDTDGEPLSGIGVYYTLPHSKEHRLLGKTDGYGVVTTNVEETADCHGWKLSAGLGTAVKDDEGAWYLVPEEVTKQFYVEYEDGVLTYFIHESFEMEKSALSGDVLNACGLRVVLRGDKTDKGEVISESYYTTGLGSRTEYESWVSYYDTMMSRDRFTVDGKIIENYWKCYMTESMAGRYGAWLLPLSEDGQLPRQNAERIFAPLYLWEDDGAVPQLVYAEDFRKEDPEDPDFVPYASYAFDFGAVPTGRYELAVLLPDESTYFEEVTILSGETLSVDANSWTKVDTQNSRVRRLWFDPTIYSLEGEVIGEASEDRAPTFALCVDQTGRRVWSYVIFGVGGKGGALLPVGAGRTNENGQYYGIECFSGQMYLLTPSTDYHLFGVDYQYHCEYNAKGWHYRGAYISRIYGIDAEDPAIFKPTYVEFVERFYTADGKPYYKTVTDTVRFTLYWDKSDEYYPESWCSLMQARPDFAISQNNVGILQNDIYRRDNTAGEGVTYTFRYGKTVQEYFAGYLPSVLSANATKDSPQTAELLSLQDDCWTKTGVPRDLFGTAWLKSKEIKGANGKPVTLIAQAEDISTDKGTVYRFLFSVSCSTYGHDWRQSGNTVWCSRCGTKDTAEMPQVIEYVVPEGVTVEAAPTGWYVEGLPYPDGTPTGVDNCLFAGWSEKPVEGTALRPNLMDDADEYYAPLKTKDGEYVKIKLYAVFKTTVTSRITENLGNYSGNITLALENVHEYQNFGTAQTPALLTVTHLAEVAQQDYCLTLRGDAVRLTPISSLEHGALVVDGDGRSGYKIGTEGLVTAPVWLCCSNGVLSVDGTGTLFDISLSASGQTVIRSKEDGSYLTLDGLNVRTTSQETASFTPFWTGTYYICTADDLPVEQELIFAQVPFQNQYDDDELNLTGGLLAMVETRCGTVISVTDMTNETVTYHTLFHTDGEPLYYAEFYDAYTNRYLRAYVPVTVVSPEHLPNTTYQLQLGGTWKTRFRLGKDTYTHEGQTVCLLFCDGNNVYDAQCLTAADVQVSALPEWDFDLDIANPAGIPAGTYQVTVGARAFSRTGRPTRTLAAAGYQIHLVNSVVRPFPGNLTQFDREAVTEWLEERIVDPNIRQAVEELLGQSGWSGRVDLWLERLGIYTLEGIGTLPNVSEVWVRDNNLTQVNPADVAGLETLVLGRQTSTITVHKYGGTVTAELSRVISRENLQYVRSVSALAADGAELQCTYQPASGRVEIQTVPHRAAANESVTIRYEYEVPYGNGKTALMTVYLTPSAVIDTEVPENADTFTPYLRTAVTGTDRADTFRFALSQEGEEAISYLTVDGSGLGTFAPITLAEGVCEYQVSQIPDETLPYTYDSRVYTALVIVGSGGAILGVTWSCNGWAVDAPVFVNRWNKAAADTALIEVHSEQLGFPPAAAEEYFWEITPVKEGAPLPLQDTLSADGSDRAVFEIPCTAAGTWEYQIRQIAGENENCTYDSAVYTVKVTAFAAEDGIEANVSDISRNPALAGREYEIVYRNFYKDTAIHEHTYVDGVCTECHDTDPDYTPTDPCEGYTDINRSAWYHTAADFVIERGLMGSTKTDKLTFEPNTKVSRAMVASILYRMAGSPAAEYRATFTDVPSGKWFTTAIEWCAQNGLASGKGNGKFDPNGNVTRQELAVFMKKMAEYLEKNTDSRDDLTSFADASKVPAWAKTYVQWAVSAGLISGKASNGKTYLAPTDNATRAEFASIIMRFVRNIAEP